MIEITVIKYLSDLFPCPVEGELEPQAPGQVITVRSGGTERVNRIDTTSVILSSYGDTMLEAARLNEAVKNAMDELDVLDSVSSSKLVTDYPAPDTNGRRYCYQAVYNVTHY